MGGAGLGRGPGAGRPQRLPGAPTARTGRCCAWTSTGPRSGSCSTGKAYRCRCTREELDQRRARAEKQGRPFLYDGRCRDRHPAVPDDSEPATIRLTMPRTGEIVLDDLVKGRIAVPADSLDDWIIARMDGTPTYNFSWWWTTPT